MGTDAGIGYKKKLIEVALPLEAISHYAAKEKSIRHGHPSTLHLWWSRKPLAAARAVLFAQLVDDPSARPDKYPTVAEQDKRREELFELIGEMVKWENSNNKKILRRAWEEIFESCDGNPPPILDPFAGGGTIPLEAQRLGLEAHASDLNPVAVLINKALIEIPPKWKDQPPIFPGAADQLREWRGAEGLAEDIRLYGKWMRDEAEKRIGHLYPKAKLPCEYGGGEATVIAWIWARTVTCPNLACGGTMPLVNKFWLGKKKGKERYIVPVVDPGAKEVRFEIGGPTGQPREGTVVRTGAVCLLCEAPVPLEYIRAQGKAKRIGAQLMAIACEGDRKRIYLPPNEEHIAAAELPRPDDVPDTDLPEQALGFRVQNYGMTKHADLFTNRQLVALSTLTNIVQEIRSNIGNSYGDAIATYLGFAVSKTADRSSSFCAWDCSTKTEGTRNVFVRQALSMVWDYSEANIFVDASGGLIKAVEASSEVVSRLPGRGEGHVSQEAAQGHRLDDMLLATDPPYGDNVGYAALADFFYIWLRRSLREVHPTIFGTLLTPKDGELISEPDRHDGSATKADSYFQNEMESVFLAASQTGQVKFPASIFYAFKQTETTSEDGVSSTGWETFLSGVIKSGWQITATWPMRTELGNRMRSFDSNALASSIVIAARIRAADAPVLDLRGFRALLHSELPDALRAMQKANIGPVDMQQAAIGPAIAIYSRYSQITLADGTAMSVRTALGIINEILDDVLDEELGDVDADTRWCVKWSKQYGWNTGSFSDAETLFKSTGTSMPGLVHAGVVKEGAGKVQLIKMEDLPATYDPVDRDRATVWEATLHLAQQLKASGIDSAGAFLVRIEQAGVELDSVKALAYRLYDTCNRHNWSSWALPFNQLVQAWPEVTEAAVKAREQKKFVPVQEGIDFDALEEDE